MSISNDKRVWHLERGILGAFIIQGIENEIYNVNYLRPCINDCS